MAVTTSIEIAINSSLGCKHFRGNVSIQTKHLFSRTSRERAAFLLILGFEKKPFFK